MDFSGQLQTEGQMCWLVDIYRDIWLKSPWALKFEMKILVSYANFKNG